MYKCQLSLCFFFIFLFSLSPYFELQAMPALHESDHRMSYSDGIGSGMAIIADVSTPVPLNAVGTVPRAVTALQPFYKTVLSPWLSGIDKENTHSLTMENINFYAPDFHQGFIGLTYFDFKNDNSEKQIGVLYPDGLKVLWTLKHGQQLKIDRAGTIVDLTPGEADLTQKNIFYVTHQMIEEATVGIALNNNYTYYVMAKDAAEPPIYHTLLLHEFCRVRAVDIKHPYYETNLAHFAQALLDDEERAYVTLHTKLTNKEALTAYLDQDPRAQQDFKSRYGEALSNAPSLEAAIRLRQTFSDEQNLFTIIPVHKGGNKVLLQASRHSKQAFKYFSAGSENDTHVKYTDFPTADGICELTLKWNTDIYGRYCFELEGKNGLLLTDTPTFTFDLNNDSIKNWLIEWYPGQEHEKHVHDLTEQLPDGVHRDLVVRQADGTILRNRWFQFHRYSYYAGGDAKPVTGFRTIRGKTYYFDKDRFYAYRNALITIGNKSYYFNSQCMQTDFINIGDTFYFYNNHNRLDPDIIQEIQEQVGTMMRAEMNGIAGYTGIIRSEKLNAFISFNNGTVDAIWIKGQCHSLGARGWKSADGVVWFYFHHEGERAATGWQYVNSAWHYFNTEGVMQVGLQKINGKIYYLDEKKGCMMTEWQKINNKWYYFSKSGEAKIGYFIAARDHTYPFHFREGASHYMPFPFYAREDGSVYQNMERIRLPLTNGEIDYFTFNERGYAERDYQNIRGSR